MPAKITLAIRYAAAYKLKREEMANAGVYTNNTSPLANKDKDNAYNRAYKPPTNIKEEGSSKDNSKEEEDKSSNNNSTGDSAGNSKDKARRKLSNSSLRYKAPPSTAYADIYVYYI
ncbi:hypothetical protein P8C59_009574 [Phyllachora maydis]|uniref:Uncharacterized protein n=1 Tax=Phyllachora maydis TaxID=1825666 RepID=A0AAD9IDN1_9PEZI|nr:hypothetical protein P8C59_009574 [Phyllachora maydis]